MLFNRQGPALRPMSGEESPWQPPTGDTQRLVRVLPDERTCLACGDTFTGTMCERCGRDEQGTHARKALPPSVATITYLRAGEYEEVR